MGSVLLILLMFAGPGGTPALAAGPPNVLFIVTDDQRLSQPGGVNSTLDVMPKTKGWFETGRTLEGTGETFDGGTFFPNGIANTPLCCPARASIFSGRYSHNNNLDRNPEVYNDPEFAAFDQNATLQRYLHDAGYRTALYGKFFNSWDLTADPPHWDDWTVLDKSGYSPVVVNDQGTIRWVWRYTTNYLRDKALDFLQDTHAANPDQPWFMYLAPSTPHGPFNPEPRFANDAVPALQETPAFFEADRTDKPKWLRTGYTDADEVKTEWAQHLRMLKSADDLVDSVMRRVAALGDERDTIAVFVGDNGYSWGEHGRRAKPNPYWENVHVPYFMRWPNSPSQTGKAGTDTRMAAFVDLAPTVVNAVNAAGGTPIVPSPAMDGITLTSPTQPARNHAFSESTGTGPPILIQGSPSQGFCNGTPTSWNSVLTPTFHYIEYYQTYWAESSDIGGCATFRLGAPVEFTTNYSNVTFREYYDLTQDPQELTNLLGDPNTDNDPPTAQLHAVLDQDRQCQGQSCIPQAGAPAQLAVDVAINRRPDSSTSATDASFTFASTEPTATFACRQGDPALIDTLPFQPCTSPTTYTNLTAGSHAFHVKATAAASTDTDTHTWQVGSSFPPSTTLTAVPPDPAQTRSATFQFSSSATLGTFECRAALSASISSAPWASCASPFDYTAPSDGTYSFEVRATDGLTGPDATPASRTWTIDTAAPETTLSDTPPATSNSPGATFVFSTSDGAAGLECKLDSGNWGQCTSPKVYGGLAQGSHSFSVRARDINGNVDSTPSTFNWSIGTLQTFANSPDPTWPEISAGTEVRAVVSDGSGGWYVGGDFTKVRDAAGEHDHVDLVHINASKTVDDNWRPATVDGEVRSILTSGGMVYVGGSFTGVMGNDDPSATSRNRLAAFHDAAAASGSRGEIAAWNPDADNDVNAIVVGSKRDVGANTISQAIYVAGAFQSLGGAARSKVAELDMSSGAPTSWSPSVPAGIDLFALQVTSLTTAECAGAGCGNLGNVYVGGGGVVGGVPEGVAMEIDRATGQTTSWQPDPDGFIYALRVRQGLGGLPTLYAGGLFDNIGLTPAERRRAAELNLSDTGNATSWDPSPNAAANNASVRGFLPFSCGGSDPTCATVLTGAFTSLGAASRSMIADVDSTTGTPDTWASALTHTGMALACWPTTNCDQQTTRVLAVGGRFIAPRKLLAFYGRFDSTAPSADLGLTHTDSPDPVNANGLLTYTVTVQNSGPSTATSLRLTDELPSAVTYQSATSSQGSCSQSSGVVTCELGSLAGSASASVTIVVRALVDGQLVNQATVSAAQSDPTPLDNTASQTTTVNPNSYARPKGATPVFFSVVPAFSPCASQNRAHEGPLSYGACNPPASASGNLTVGTPDSNGAAANMTGFVRLDVCPVVGCVAPDVRFQASVSDVRCDSGPTTCVAGNSSSGPDYTGELRTRLVLRITDKQNGPSLNEAATGVDTPVFAPVPCAATGTDPMRGSNCSTLTSLNALVAGAVVAGKHAIWETETVEISDGGTDGDAETAADNEPFMRPGVFLP